MWVDGLLDLGTPSTKSIVDDAAVPLFDVADFAGVPKTLEWVLEVRDGKRVLIPGLNLGPFFLVLGKRMGEGSSVGQEQEDVRASLLAGSDARTTLTSYKGCGAFFVGISSILWGRA